LREKLISINLVHKANILKDKDHLNFATPESFLASLNKEEQEAINNLNSIKEFAKGSVLISEGQYFRESYFVKSGLVRQFRIDDGKEITSNFYTENQSIDISLSASQEKVSPFTLICEEDSKISVVSFEEEKEIYRRFPRFEKMCRITSERQLGEFQAHFSKFISSSPEERYKNLIAERPDLLNRVPQYHLSSYLGMKPESLSRIRKRLAKK